MGKLPDVRIAVIGAGRMGSEHTSTLSFATKNAVVSHVVDLDLSRAADVADPIEGAVATTDVDAAIAEADAVVIAAPEERHRMLIEKVLAAGTPMLCEKPLATTIEDCLAVVEAERAAHQRLISVGFMRRFDPGYRALRRFITEGNDGPPLLIHNVHRNVQNQWETTADQIRYLPVHEFDAIRWLSGEEITQVTAYTGKQSEGKPADLNDPIFIVCRTASGVIADIEMYSNAKYGYEVRCEVVCDSGTASLDGSSRSASAPAAIGDPQLNMNVCRDWRDRFSNAYRLELQAWITSVREPQTGFSELASAYDGYASLLVAQACIESLETGKPVDVEPQTSIGHIDTDHRQ